MSTQELVSDFDPFAGPAILDVAPTTEPQRELWTATRLGSEASLAFNESITLTLRGDVDVLALGSALEDLVARHAALRSTFSADGTSLLVGPPLFVAPKLNDLSARADRDAVFTALLESEVQTPFDLEHGPVCRAHLVRMSPQEVRAIFTAHHLVCDGWSTAVIVREWAALYSARKPGHPVALEPAESIAAYAREQARTGAASKPADEAYWLSRFSGELPVLELPTDRVRPAQKTYASRRMDRLLPEELVSRVRRAAARERGSLFNALLAGFGVLMGRLTGQEDVVIGIPSAGQGVGDHETLVGHCVNTLPIRLAPARDKSFLALLAETRRATLDASEHQAFTYGRLLRSLPLARDPSRLPLASVCFNLDRGLSEREMPFAGLEVQLQTNPRRFETFDLFVNAVEQRGEVTLEVQFNSDLFEARTVERWMEAYAQLLDAASLELATPIANLPMLTPREQGQLDAWNATERSVPGPQLIHRRFEEQVAENPERIAVQTGNRVVTFGSLNARANQLARRLRELGVGRGTHVGVCVERSERMLVGLLGALKAGAAYVPLDPGFPKERLAFMAEDAAIAALVTEQSLSERLELKAKQVVTLDADDSLAPLDSSDLEAGPNSARSDDAAYVIYTSGSTGKPKGVAVPHRAVANFLSSMVDGPGMTASDTVLAVTTLSFDIAVLELLLPLTVGAKIVLASRETTSEGAALAELLGSSGA
ncbi:MAG: AMP-binding protein, partial [Deltaproteobacteria bacterium]|nr:AMP-binding protein [Deltaproteobacteria bacterium]